jgi:hypothetical protein
LFKAQECLYLGRDSGFPVLRVGGCPQLIDSNIQICQDSLSSLFIRGAFN